MGLNQTLDGNRHWDSNMTRALPAIAKVLIGHLLHDHKAPELVVRDFPMGDGSKISATLASAIGSLTGVFNIEHHKYLSCRQSVIKLASRRLTFPTTKNFLRL